MYCRNCGKEIKDGASFCPYCGEPVDNSGTGSNNRQQAGRSTQTKAPNYTYQDSSNKQSSNGGHRRTTIVVVVAVIVTLCVVSILLNLPSNASDSDLKSLAQSGGISPYTFKEDVINLYGRDSYSEEPGVAEQMGENNIEARLVQFCSKDGDTMNGVYLFTYWNTINTDKEGNVAEDDILTFLGTYGHEWNVSVSDNWDYYVAESAGGSHPNLKACFCIVGNSMVCSMSYSDTLTDVESFLSKWDVNNEYDLKEKQADSRIVISDSVNELLTERIQGVNR